MRAYEYLGQRDADMFANRVDSTLLSLPIGEHLTLEDAATVVSAIKAFMLIDA